jgi:hypothetical protein
LLTLRSLRRISWSGVVETVYISTRRPSICACRFSWWGIPSPKLHNDIASRSRAAGREYVSWTTIVGDFCNAIIDSSHNGPSHSCNK